MNKRCLPIICVGLVVTLVALSSGGALSADQGRQSGAEGHEVSKRDAARLVKERYGGRVLDVQPRGGASAPGYRVKIIESGRVRVLSVDGRTGEIRR